MSVCKISQNFNFYVAFHPTFCDITHVLIIDQIERQIMVRITYFDNYHFRDTNLDFSSCLIRNKTRVVERPIFPNFPMNFTQQWDRTVDLDKKLLTSSRCSSVKTRADDDFPSGFQYQSDAMDDWFFFAWQLRCRKYVVIEYRVRMDRWCNHDYSVDNVELENINRRHKIFLEDDSNNGNVLEVSYIMNIYRCECIYIYIYIQFPTVIFFMCQSSIY